METPNVTDGVQRHALPAEQGAAEVCIFGPTRICEALGHEWIPRSRSQRRMLALLASHRHEPMNADRVGDLLEIEVGAVRTTISRLRSAIGRDLIVSSGSGYWLAVGGSDAERLEAVTSPADCDDSELIVQRRARVLRSLGGPPLDEFARELWALPEALRLGELRAEAVEAQARSFLELGRAAEALCLLQRHVVELPYRRSRTRPP